MLPLDFLVIPLDLLFDVSLSVSGPVLIRIYMVKIALIIIFNIQIVFTLKLRDIVNLIAIWTLSWRLRFIIMSVRKVLWMWRLVQMKSRSLNIFVDIVWGPFWKQALIDIFILNADHSIICDFKSEVFLLKNTFLNVILIPWIVIHGCGVSFNPWCLGIQFLNQTVYRTIALPVLKDLIGIWLIKASYVDV